MTTQVRVPRTTVEREAARTAARIRRDLGLTLRTMREDAGLSLGRVARISGVSKSHVNDIEAGRVDASHGAIARVANALGGSLAVRIYPGTGPLVRDHVSAAMVGALLGTLHPIWRPTPEVAVYRPVRGVIDLVLEAPEPPIVACEAQSELRRLEQQVRWSRAKAEALASARHAPVSRLLLVRNTARTRAIAAEFEPFLSAAYPARVEDVMAALTSGTSWPGDGIVWCQVEGRRAAIMDRPPRAIRIGR